MTGLIIGWVNIYLPRPACLPEIRKGSGIVGIPEHTVEGERIHIYFEGNLFNAVNMRHWRERVFHAASRLRTNYPTIAQAWVAEADLICIGVIDDAGHIDLIDPEDLPPEIVALEREWLDRPE